MTETISKMEIEARERIKAYRDAQDWSSLRQVALLVWKCQWSNALPIGRINTIGNALFPCDVALDLEEECTHMVDAGLLRSYMAGGQRLYELALGRRANTPERT